MSSRIIDRLWTWAIYVNMIGSTLLMWVAPEACTWNNKLTISLCVAYALAKFYRRAQ